MVPFNFFTYSYSLYTLPFLSVVGSVVPSSFTSMVFTGKYCVATVVLVPYFIVMVVSKYGNVLVKSLLTVLSAALYVQPALFGKDGSHTEVPGKVMVTLTGLLSTPSVGLFVTSPLVRFFLPFCIVNFISL